jgi:hypothetical protein
VWVKVETILKPTSDEKKRFQETRKKKEEGRKKKERRIVDK